MDCQVIVSPLQPEPFVVKDAVDGNHALKVALHFCWVNYPGFFSEVPASDWCLTYHEKYLAEGYPIMGLIGAWQ